MTNSEESTLLFTVFHDLVSERVDGLTMLDAASGDGDFGENLRSGLAAVQDDTRATERNGFSSAAKVFLDDVGGTSGPLLGLLFQELAAAEPTGKDLSTTFQHGLGSGLEAIQRVGGARPGDRTLVDALAPAVEAIENTHHSLVEAAAAAVSGARHTATLIARRGRASYVGKRAIGLADPGAIGIALLLVSALSETNDQAELLAEIDSLLQARPS